MGQKEIEKEIIDLLYKNEITMGKLYGEFARQFPMYRPFWEGIVTEEESHAAWIETLYRKTEGGLVEFAEKRFPIEAIRQNVENMEAVLEEAKKGEMTAAEALEKAVHFEHGMLENKFFEVFEGDSAELQLILEALRLGTQEHFRRVEEVWKKETMNAETENKLR